jgi:methanol corrinoid protein
MKAFALGIEVGKRFKENKAIFELIEKGLSTKDPVLEEVPRIGLDALLPIDEPFKSIAYSVAKGDVEETVRLVKKASNEGMKDMAIATEGLLKGMNGVSTLYNHKQAYVPEILLAAKAMDAGLKECSGLETRETKGTILIYTAEGDLHDIGKNIVAAIMAANGYRVIDLGTSVGSGQVLEAIKCVKPVAVLGSSLMTSTRGAFLEMADLLKKESIDMPFIIGGGACDVGFARMRKNIGHAEGLNTLIETLNSHPTAKEK